MVWKKTGKQGTDTAACVNAVGGFDSAGMFCSASGQKVYGNNSACQWDLKLLKDGDSVFCLLHSEPGSEKVLITCKPPIPRGLGPLVPSPVLDAQQK